MAPSETYSGAREVTLDLQREVRESIGRHLLGSQRLRALRLRLSLADYCWVKHTSVLPTPYTEC